jgi:hypothetical protein
VLVNSAKLSEVDSSGTHEIEFIEFQEVDPVELEIVLTVTHQIRLDVQGLSKFLNDDSPVQVSNSYFLETTTKLHQDSGNCGPEPQVNFAVSILVNISGEKRCGIFGESEPHLEATLPVAL